MTCLSRKSLLAQYFGQLFYPRSTHNIIMCVTRGRCGVLAACDGMMESVTWLLTDYSPAHVTSWPANQRPDVGPIDQSEAGKMLTDSPPQIDCHDMGSCHNGHNVPDICWTLTVGFYEDDLKVDPWWMLDFGKTNTGIDKLSQIGTLSRFIKSRLYLSNEVRGRQIVLHVKMSASSFKIYWWTRLKVMRVTWETAKM